MSSLCVYCGSSSGNDPAYREAARALGQRLGAEGITLIYGGGNVGLMGEVANATLAAGGEVTGVIPTGLRVREVGHEGLTRLEEVGSMHERKQRMFELADAFVALPGGFGTLEELIEVATWGQLGKHRKPIVMFDVAGYWTELLRFLDSAVEHGLLRAENRALIADATDLEGVFAAIAAYDVPLVDKWMP
ncbi:MAG: TIGR00730 family Rossman fold protein [Deltaproteobacteria bacterium]|nr:TIGR00730 family Rossman fold protein [Deltaproteobacteria bacterium]